MEEDEAESYVKNVKSETSATQKETAANEGFEEASKATEDADKEMGKGDHLMQDIDKDISAENDALKSTQSDDPSSATAPAMAKVADVAAEVEKLGVKVKAAAADVSNKDD